jgi:TPR repeat protein
MLLFSPCPALAADSSSIKDAELAALRGDYKTEMKILLPYAEQGNAEAQRHIGWLYHVGYGVPKNEAEAQKWFGLALKSYRSAADKGDTAGQYWIGAMYLNGWGVKQNKDEAIKWILLAAKNGDAYAQVDLGRQYLGYWGSGNWPVIRDSTEAEKWFRKAADQGYAPGQYNLGTMYEFGGTVVKQDYLEAYKLYYRAAQQGYEYAQEKLSDFYLTGKGVKQDVTQAYFWSLVGNGDSPKSKKEKLAVFEHSLPPSQISEARQLASRWKPVAHPPFPRAAETQLDSKFP